MILNSYNDLKDIRNKFLKKTIVLSHGVFDIFHYGHLKYIEMSKKHGDILIVSITNDNYVKNGKVLPMFSSKYRISIIDSLKPVDYCYVCNELSCIEVIKNLKPNIYCKGSDVKGKELNSNENLYHENKELVNIGGKLIFIPEVMGFHSTIIKNKCI